MVDGVRIVPVRELLTDDFASAIRWHYDVQKEPHEATFEIFRHFSGDDEMFLDVGANIGNSVVSFRIFNKKARIFSLEPIEILRPALEAVKEIEQDRYDFIIAGASAAPLIQTLYVPSAANRPVFYLASLDSRRFGPDPARIAGMQQLMGRPLDEEYGVTMLSVRLVTIDSLNLRPTLVKIDAEGHEFDVLSGMTRTIDATRPLFLLEGGNARADVAQFMADRDYNFALARNGVLELTNESKEAQDGFFLANERLDFYRAKGALR